MSHIKNHAALAFWFAGLIISLQGFGAASPQPMPPPPAPAAVPAPAVPAPGPGASAMPAPKAMAKVTTSQEGKVPVVKIEPSPIPSGDPAATSSGGPSEEGNGKRGADALPSGRELVNMDFPELTDIKDIIKAMAIWTGKNVILDRNVSGKVQIISPKKVTKEEAYQAFLSALNLLNLTTVETGKVIKIMKVRQAVKGNLKTYLGAGWAPRTDEIITQIIPLKYVDSKAIQSTLSRIVSSNSMIAYEPTNTLIVSDSGYKVKRVLDILELLDVQTQQPKVMIVPIKYSDPKSIADKVSQIVKGDPTKGSRSSYLSFKILTDERSNSVIIFGPPRTIQDIRELVKKFDMPMDDPSSMAAIHVRPLDYADAKKLSTTLSALASGNKSSSTSLRRPPVKNPDSMKSSGGDEASVADLGDGVKITADDSSNSLLITGSRSAYDALNSIIRKLDIRRAQVFIESDILDINQVNNFNFGTSIFLGSGSKDGTGAKQIYGWQAQGISPLVVAAGQASTATAGTSNPQAAASVAGAFAQNMSIGIIGGQEVKVPGLGTFSPAGLINLIKTDAAATVLASPHILTSNNEEASISVGQTIFYKTANTTSTGVISEDAKKEKVDLTLTIKPNISNSNYITLNLSIDSNKVLNFDPTSKLPNIANRKTKQVVTVKNGQTIVMSGMLSSSESETYQKIPLLGDIPILGWLFRNSDIKKESTNLMVFLTPYVVHGAADLATIYESKRQDRDQFLERMYGSSIRTSEIFKRLPNKDDGAYKATPSDEAEDKRVLQQKQAALREIGYDDDNRKGPQVPVTNSNARESETTVPIPAESGSSGGGGGVFAPDGDSVPSDMMDAAPPPPPPEAPVTEPNLDENNNE